jgi:hypothetical protein
MNPTPSESCLTKHVTSYSQCSTLTAAAAAAATTTTTTITTTVKAATMMIKVKVKGKVKLTLCFQTEHHVMKAYWGSGGIAPLIL